jgi:CBS domain containing-hemolysin-like protein
MTWTLAAICLTVSFIFSGVEAGILSVNRVRLRHRVKQKDRAALVLDRLLAQPERLLITVLVVTNLMNVFAITLVVEGLVRIFALKGYLIALAVFLPIYLLGVELLPKSFFRRFPYRALAMLAGPLRLADIVLTPMHRIGEGISRLVGGRESPSQKLFVAREDFKYLTIETERAGSLTPVERKMIHGVVDFRSLTARDVMLPVDQVRSIAGRSELTGLIREASTSGIDRWPVKNENGGFSGIVNLLDVALSVRQTGAVESLQRRIVKLAPNEPAYTVLHKLRAARSSMAAVLAADGTPLGIVTWEAVILRLVKSAAA